MRQDHLEEGGRALQAQGLGRFILAGGDCQQGTTEDLRLVGRGVEDEGQQRAVPGFAEEPPHSHVLPEAFQRSKAVVQQEQLGQQWRATEEVDVTGTQALQQQAVGQPRQGQQHAEQGAEGEGNRHQLAGDQQAVDKARAVAFQQVGIENQCQQLIETHVRALRRWRLKYCSINTKTRPDNAENSR
ncbi:hypothetical protein D3C81_1124280 [compost metagenome]